MAKKPKAGKIGETPTEKKGKKRAAAKLEKTVGKAKSIPRPPRDREADLDRAPRWEPRYPGSGRLAGKVAIVTGGDSGIGRAICALRSEEHTSELQSLMRISYAVFCMKQKKKY